jgi:chitinase
MRRRILVSLVSLGVAAAAVGSDVLLARSADAATLSSDWYASAPYLMPFDNSPPDPVTVMNATGQKAFQLAFILAPNGGGCTPTWEGTRDVGSDNQAASTTAYGGGSVVGYGGHRWTAEWWTQGDTPGNNGQGVWSDNGPC